VFVHPKGTPCLFSFDETSDKKASECCAFRATELRLGLLGFCDNGLVVRLDGSMTSEDAKIFGKLLRAAALDLSERQQGLDADIVVEYGRLIGYLPNGKAILSKPVTLEQTISRLYRAAEWYEIVASFGLGVRVEFLPRR